MIVELFHSPGCSSCAAAQASLKEAALLADESVEWRELDVLDELDYAVELGVLTLPAVAVDHELAFGFLPTAEQLREFLMRRKAGAP